MVRWDGDDMTSDPSYKTRAPVPTDYSPGKVTRKIKKAKRKQDKESAVSMGTSSCIRAKWWSTSMW